MNDIVFLSGRRTPYGAFGGTLKSFTATDLGVHAASAAIEAAGIQATDVDTKNPPDGAVGTVRYGTATTDGTITVVNS